MGQPWQIADLPFAVSFFARQPHRTSQTIEDFYSEAHRFEAAHNDIQAAIKHGNPQEIRRYGGVAQAAVSLQQFKTQLADKPKREPPAEHAAHSAEVAF
jgi:hypothetical protein